jgi:hypothetical protein
MLVKQRAPLSVRAYSILCAIAFLPLAPLFFAGLGSAPRHPIDLADGIRKTDGSMIAARPRGTAVYRVRIGTGPWLPASSPAVGRQLRNVPLGSEIDYQTRAGVVGGVVERQALPMDRAVAGGVRGIVALFFLIAGLALAIAGQNRPSRLAAGFLSGAGAMIAFAFIEPNVVRIASADIRNLLIAAVVAIPAGLWGYFLLRLCAEFPNRVDTGPAFRAGVVVVSALALGRAFLLAFAQVPPLFDRLPWLLQFRIMALLEGGLLQNLSYPIVAVLGLAAAMRQRRSAEPLTRDLARRTRIAYLGMLAGLLPALLAVFVQAAALLTVHRQVIPPLMMSLALFTLVSIPITITYALLARRVATPSILARRAVMFSVASGAGRFIAALPLAALITLVYLHREQPVIVIVSQNAMLIVVLLALMIAAFRVSGQFNRWLERVFFRLRHDVREVLASAVVKMRSGRSTAELSRIVEEEIDAALHLESICLFVRVRDEEFASQQSGVTGLAAGSTIAQRLLHTSVPIPISSRWLGELPEDEKHWIEQRDFRLLVPLIGFDQSLAAILALGEKLSELPFSRDDLVLLNAVAGSAAVNVENIALREHPPLVTVSESDDLELARICEACGRIYPSESHSRCAVDDTPLARSSVPYLCGGKIRFEARIGHGAMAVVYRARDLSLSRTVAVKTLPRASADAIARFKVEARVSASILHPNVATVFAVELWRGIPMLVVEYLDGGTLADHLGQSTLDETAMVRLGIALCSGLAEAHARGVLHRDIKPSNIAFMAASRQPKILDFGLARFIEDASVASSPHAMTLADEPLLRISSSLGVAGTPLYLSPEALLGAPSDVALDLWALSVTLYEAFTGVHPFAEATAVRTMNRILSKEVSNVRSVRADASGALDEFFRNALHPDRTKRPASAIGMGKLLSEVISH